MGSGLNSQYFHMRGDGKINPIVGVYIPIYIIRIPMKVGMTISNIGSWSTLAQIIFGCKLPRESRSVSSLMARQAQERLSPWRVPMQIQVPWALFLEVICFWPFGRRGLIVVILSYLNYTYINIYIYTYSIHESSTSSKWASGWVRTFWLWKWSFCQSI